MIEARSKDPDAQLNYVVDFRLWLAPTDTIVSAVVIIENGTVLIDGVETAGTLAEVSHDVSDTEVRVKLKDGLVGEVSTVTVRATTAAAEITDYSFKIKIREA